MSDRMKYKAGNRRAERLTKDSGRGNRASATPKQQSHPRRQGELTEDTGPGQSRRCATLNPRRGMPPPAANLICSIPLSALARLLFLVRLTASVHHDL